MTNLYSIKMIIVGEPAVGKTSLIKRFVKGDFTSDYQVTIGADFYTKELAFLSNDEKNEVRLTIWDMAGQKVWKEMRRFFYKGAQCAFIVGDLSRKDTFDRISEFWLKDFQKSFTEPIPTILIGNKKDLSPAVTDNEIDELIKDSCVINWFKTSAKIGAGINEAFVELIKKCTQIETMELISI